MWSLKSSKPDWRLAGGVLGSTKRRAGFELRRVRPSTTWHEDALAKPGIPVPTHNCRTDALSRKFREDHEEHAAPGQAQRGVAAQQPQQVPPHLQALQAAGQAQQAAAGSPPRQLTQRPAPAAASRPQQFRVPYRLSSKAGATGRAAVAAEGASTQGLLLPVPQYSLQQLGP